MPKHVVFLGPPACGKGTQARFLVEKFSYKYISTGDLIRAEMKSLSKESSEIKETIHTGRLINSDIVNSLVQKCIEKNDKMSVLFDGYPRTIDQALFIDGVLKSRNEKIDSVFCFEINYDELIERVLNRFSCSGCGFVYNVVTNTTKIEGVCDFCGGKDFIRRGDDSEMVLKNRIESYVAETEPLKAFYKKQNLLKIVDARESISAVREQILNRL